MRTQPVSLFAAIVLPSIAVLSIVVFPTTARARATCTLDGKQYSPGACVRNFTFVCSDPDSVCRCQGDGLWYCCLTGCEAIETE